MILPLAHAGHWLAQFLLFAPVFAFVIFLIVQSVRDRRRTRREHDAGPA